MKTCLCLCLITAVLLASCAGMHHGRQLQLIEISVSERQFSPCLQAFPDGQWQLVHAIAFRMAGGVQGHALGVLVLTEEEIRCALMTMEGLTLFEARFRGEAVPEVSRALAPFDNPEFAAGLMRDVRTIFRRPPGTAQYGKIATGEAVCRYISDGKVTDILPGEDGCWRIITYADTVATRIIHAHACTKDAGTVLAGFLTLTAPGVDGYTLSMELVHADPIAHSLAPSP
jgi:hypothetical protein